MRKGMFLAIFLSFFAASAAVPPLYQAKETRPKRFTTKGIYTGGAVDRPLSLLRVKVGPKKRKILLQWGDQKGEPLKDKTGHFFVSLQKNPSRIVIDLSDVVKTAVDVPALQSELKKMSWVEAVSMTMDPEDKSTNITINLKKHRAMAVSTPRLEKGERYLVIDLRPIKKRKLR